MPDGVIDEYRRESDFTFALISATRGHTAAGRLQDTLTGKWYEWAEFRTQHAAETCEGRLEEIAARFAARLTTAYPRFGGRMSFQQGRVAQFSN